MINFESRIRRRDGSLIWISDNARADHDPKGEVLYYEGTVEHLTQRKGSQRLQREKERAEAANRAKLATVISQA